MKENLANVSNAIYGVLDDKHRTLNQTFFSFFQICVASLFLVFCSQLSIPLYFSPIPLSLQTFGMMLVGACLGSRRGSLSVIAYLTQAMLGLPVLAQGKFGFFGLLGPTGGYILGFIFQAYSVGWVTERLRCFDSKKIISALSLSCCVQLGFGVLWLSTFVGIGPALQMGLYPFLFGEFIKVIAVAGYLKAIFIISSKR